jgi:thioredoxin 1
VVRETSDANFQKDVLESKLPAIVDFWAPWCGPCRVVSPIIERLGEQAAGRADVFKINVDENPASAEKYRIAGIPTVIFFNRGEVVKEFVGVQPERVYTNTLSEL